MKKEYVYERLNLTQRVRIEENRDLIKGLRLNRNERVENFNQNTLKKIFNKIPNYNLGKYPDHTLLYRYLAEYLNIKKDNRTIIIVPHRENTLKNCDEIIRLSS